MIDIDAFTQAMINAVENAIKCSSAEARRQIDIGCRCSRYTTVCVTVKEYGISIADDQMCKIFDLFYRTESGFTRETVSEGIGHALAHQRVAAMNGQVDVRNCDSDAEFSRTFSTAAGH